MNIDTDDFRVCAGAQVDLGKWPTDVKPVFKSHEQYKKRIKDHVEKLSSLQHLHYATHRYAVLLSCGERFVICRKLDESACSTAPTTKTSLSRACIRIIKFYLHLSKDEQRKRFLDRIEEPEKNWKFSLSDVKERGFWDQYMTAFEECLTETTTKDVPWYVVPADNKDNARLIVSQIVVDSLEALNMSDPGTAPGAGSNKA